MAYHTRQAVPSLTPQGPPVAQGEWHLNLTVGFDQWLTDVGHGTPSPFLPIDRDLVP